MHHKKKIYLILYINNIKFIESDEHALDEISCQIAEHFQIMNKDQIHHYLSMKIEINCQAQDSTIHLSQKIYIKQLLEQFCYRISRTDQSHVTSDPWGLDA